MNPMIKINNIVILVIIILILYLTSIDENYIPTPVVSKYQDYSWLNTLNPNIGFAPAVHFERPSKKECLEFVKDNYSNPDEAFTKFIECLQNATSKVWIKNLPIQSPGIGEEE